MSNSMTVSRWVDLLKQGASPEQLEQEAENPRNLAQALWDVVCSGHGAEVGRSRKVLALLQGVDVQADDFLALLQQTAAAQPPWLMTGESSVDGLAYTGWCEELERMFRGLVSRDNNLDVLANAELPEPVFSSLRFAMKRRGFAVEVPAAALERLARAFLVRASRCPEQFEGWEKVWTAEQLGTAAWAHVDAVQEIGVKCDVLAPLVPFASTEQLMTAMRKLVWPERVVKEWLANRRQDTQRINQAALVEQLLSVLPARPEPLPQLAEAMASLPPEAVDRVQTVLRPMFDRSNRDYRWRFTDALSQLSSEDFLPVLRNTAGRMSEHRDEMKALCSLFAGQAALPVAATWWWSDGSLPTVAAILDALGTVAVPALLSRLDGGWIAEDARAYLLEKAVELAPAQCWQRLVVEAGNKDMQDVVAKGLASAWSAGVTDVGEWVGTQLTASHRTVALKVLNHHPDLRLVGALEKLRPQKLAARDRHLLESALAAPKALAPPRTRSDRRLQLHTLANLGEAITNVRLASHGQVLCATTANEIHLWRDRHVMIERALDDDGCAVSVDAPQLSPDGEWLLTMEMDRDTVGVYQPWVSTKRLRELETDDGLGSVVPLAGGQAFTLCASNNASSPLTLWDLQTGTSSRHRVREFPQDVVPLDDNRYLLASGDGSIEIRALATGKVLQKLRAAEDGNEAVSISVGDSGRLAAAGLRNGTLLLWDLSGSKAQLLHEHPSVIKHVGNDLVLADPGSRWVAVLGDGVIRMFQDGLASTSLPVQGESVKLAFARPGVLVVAGNVLDLWNLEGDHIGTAECPVAALSASSGRVVVGDTHGVVRELAL